MRVVEGIRGGERMLEGDIGAARDLEKGVIVSAECSELGEGIELNERASSDLLLRMNAKASVNL